MHGIVYSVIFHALVVLAVAFGLPWLTKPPANASRNIEVEIVRLSDITRVSKGEKPKPRTERKPDAERETTKRPVARDRSARERPAVLEPVKPKPPAPPRADAPTRPPPRPAPPKVAEPAPKPKAAPPKRVEIDPRALQRQPEQPKKKPLAKKPPPPKPEPVAKPKKKPAKEVAKPKKAPRPAPPKTARKPAPKVERQVAALPRMRPPEPRRPKKTKPPKKTAKKPPPKKDSLDSVFKTVGKLKKSATQSDRKRTAARTPEGAKTAASSEKMTVSEIAAIGRQIRRCWNFPAGAQDAGSLRVEIRVWLNRDGSLRDAKVLNRERLAGNPKLQAAADAGLRAVKNPGCSPLKLPPAKFDQWKVLTIEFDPSTLKSG